MATFFKSLLAILLSLFVSIIILIAIIVGVVAGAAQFVAPPIESPKVGTILEINMAEQITDSPIQMPLLNLRKMSITESSPLSLLSTLRALEIAASDPNITALSLRLDGEYRLPLALAEELRSAVEEFKQSSGKPVYGYSQSYTQSNYYLATVADSLFLEPLGAVAWQGIAMSSYYFGAMLEEIGVGVEAFRPTACRYKSAVEPYTRASQSEESREQSQRLVDELWEGVVSDVAKSRSLREERLRELAAEEVWIDSNLALRERMVDVVGYYDEYEEALERCGVMRNKRGGLRSISLSKYSLIQQEQELSLSEESLLGESKIGIIYADGVIVDGESESGEESTVGSESLRSLLRKAREDEDVKAVVLRVNSPGGSALAADVMWQEVELLRAKKPVVVSMGSYAASGGYYISAPADIIVADRYTLTGSIGVYSLMFNYAESMSKNLKINIDGVGSAPSADFGRTPRSMNQAERDMMLRSVDNVYDTFTDKVAKGRNLSRGVVSALAGGRVWSGAEAQTCGLVDAVGGLHKALSLAIDRSSLAEGKYKIIEITEEQSGMDMFMSMVGVSVNSVFGLGDIAPALRQLRRVEAMENGMVMHSPEMVEF